MKFIFRHTRLKTHYNQPQCLRIHFVDGRCMSNLTYQRILIIENDEIIQNFMRPYTGDNGYQLIWASNPAEMKLHLLEDAELGVVFISQQICDTDFTLINEIKKINPFVRIIIVAQKWHLNAVRKAMRQGAYDYLILPLDEAELTDLINNAIKQSLSRIKDAKNRQKLLGLQRDLEIAGEVQEYILPEKSADFSGCTIHARMIPTRSIGGDFYDYFNLDDDRIGILIGDVSGKGIPAALFMAMTRALIKMTAVSGIPPDQCLQRVNTALSRENPSLMFATVFYAVLNMKNNELIYCNAGHDEPYRIKTDHTVNTLPRTGNTALGIDENSVYKCHKTSLDTGDIIFLYTDGVTEATDIHNKMYGRDRMESNCRRFEGTNPGQFLEEILADLDIFSSGTAQSDDITMVAFALNHHPDEIDSYAFKLRNMPEEITVLHKNIGWFCQKNDLTGTIQFALEIALEELLINAINYAFPDEQNHQIHYYFHHEKFYLLYFLSQVLSVSGDYSRISFIRLFQLCLSAHSLAPLLYRS